MILKPHVTIKLLLTAQDNQKNLNQSSLNNDGFSYILRLTEIKLTPVLEMWSIFLENKTLSLIRRKRFTESTSLRIQPPLISLPLLRVKREVCLRVSHVVAGANERRLYLQAKNRPFFHYSNFPGLAKWHFALILQSGVKKRILFLYSVARLQQKGMINGSITVSVLQFL